MMQVNIKKMSEENANFRKVLYTGKHSQLVVMSILPGEEIGAETHPETDQILFVIEGVGEVVIGSESKKVEEDDVVFVPMGINHNVKNTGDEDLKICTLYAPPEHAHNTVHKTKEEAIESEK